MDEIQSWTRRWKSQTSIIPILLALSQPCIRAIWLIVDRPPPTVHWNHIDYVDHNEVNQVSHDSDDGVLLKWMTRNVDWIKSYNIT
jgi:hypothetical protein